MTPTRTSMPPMSAVLWPETKSKQWLRYLILTFSGSLLLAITAKVQFPFYPVPMTLQTLAVLIIGATFGWRLASATVFLYLAEGAIGFPVFAEGGGLIYFTGPTAGYLFGFLVAATIMGWLAEKGWDRSIAFTVVAMLIGESIIFAFGVGWLASFIGLEKAITAGFTPFIIAEVFKIAVATILLPMSWRLINQKID